METKHTPGPWNNETRYGKYCQEIGNGGNKAVAYVWTRQDGPLDHEINSHPVIAWPEGEANACLIAAAPDLLDALQMLWAEVEVANDEERQAHLTFDEIAQIEAAIDKAKA